MDTIIETYLIQLSKEFKRMTDLLLGQLDLIRKLLNGAPADEALEKVKKNECEIDNMEVRLRENIINSIVLQSPRAGNLRHIISYYDAIIDLERIADVLYNICKRMHYMQKEGSIFPVFQQDILNLFLQAEQMIQNAVFAFFREDKEIAHSVIIADEELDRTHHNCHKKLLAVQTDEQSHHPNLIADLLDIGRIFYSIERIGDGATNLAESIIFMTEGKDIKHEREIN